MKTELIFDDTNHAYWYESGRVRTGCPSVSDLLNFIDYGRSGQKEKYKLDASDMKRGTDFHRLTHHADQFGKIPIQESDPGYDTAVRWWNLYGDYKKKYLKGLRVTSELPLSYDCMGIEVMIGTQRQGLKFAGTIDRLTNTKCDGLKVIDFKTCSQIPGSVPYRYRLQLHAYRRLICENFNISPADVKLEVVFFDLNNLKTQPFQIGYDLDDWREAENTLTSAINILKYYYSKVEVKK